MTTINGLIDPKMKKKALAALDNNDTSIFEKAKSKSVEPAMKLQPSKEGQEKLNKQLLKTAEKGNTQEVKELLEKGADVNAKDEFGSTALMFASGYGHKDIVEFFISKGADVNAKDNDGITALMWAARNGHDDIVKLLISKGADVNAKNDYGWTVLMSASWHDRTAILELLRQHGAK